MSEYDNELTLDLALQQVNLQVVELNEEVLSELSDIKELKQLQSRLEETLGALHADGRIPENPLVYVRRTVLAWIKKGIDWVQFGEALIEESIAHEGGKVKEAGYLSLEELSDLHGRIGAYRAAFQSELLRFQTGYPEMLGGGIELPPKIATIWQQLVFLKKEKPPIKGLNEVLQILTPKSNKGHKWSATANNVRSGQWCPICKLDTIAQKKRKYVIDDLHKLAKSRGGECLSDKFISTNRRYKWRCALGHEWCSSWGSVHLQGTWCPDCAKGLNERICRAYFEEAFGKPFPSVRNLDWLRTPEGHALELDGYCADLKMAFEHHGEQHYRDIRFLNSPQYDELKESLCEKYGVLLVIVPQLGTLLPHTALPSHIESVIRNSGQSCKKLPAFETVDLSGAYPLNPLEDLRQVAENRGGRCISDQYLGGHISLKWECSQGHQWETAPSLIKSGAWCPHCSGNARLTIEEMQSIAASKGGKCISRTYRNSSSKLTWECARGHRWKAVPTVVKNGSWCPHCSKNRPCSIDEFHKIACERKGKCLSTEYINNKTRLHFQCEHGHQWEAIPSNVKRGKWCPKCADKNRWNGRKPTIEDMQEIARVRGGQCISSAYISTRSKVRWQCAKSHQWEATPSNVKRGAWCPICARRR